MDASALQKCVLSCETVAWPPSVIPSNFPVKFPLTRSRKQSRRFFFSPKIKEDKPQTKVW